MQPDFLKILLRAQQHPPAAGRDAEGDHGAPWRGALKNCTAAAAAAVRPPRRRHRRPAASSPTFERILHPIWSGRAEMDANAGWGLTGMYLQASAGPAPERRRQFLQCQWGGQDRAVGLTDDCGFFQCVEIATAEASYFQLCYGPQSFPPEPEEQALVDERPWSAFSFVPSSRRGNDIVFVQWQSKDVLYVSLGETRGTDVVTGDTVYGAPVKLAARHEERVRVVAVDAAGTVVASGSDDGVVHLTNVNAPCEIPYDRCEGGRIAAHDGPVTSLQFHGRRGDRLFSGGVDQRLYLWDMQSKQKLATVVMHGSPMLELATTTQLPAGAAVGSVDFVYAGHADGVLCGCEVAASPGDGERGEFDVALHFSAQHTASPILALGVSDIGDLLVTGCEEQKKPQSAMSPSSVHLISFYRRLKVAFRVFLGLSTGRSPYSRPQPADGSAAASSSPPWSAATSRSPTTRRLSSCVSAASPVFRSGQGSTSSKGRRFATPPTCLGAERARRNSRRTTTSWRRRERRRRSKRSGRLDSWMPTSGRRRRRSSRG